ncbi:MAG TPA: hypothetical protein DCX54_06490 [Flavobacteriales bacterium]|nr:hypothetical protein [Flavobacteriales bacterium]
MQVIVSRGSGIHFIEKVFMNFQPIGRGLIAFGILGIIVSLLVDLLPGSKPGIQPVQILGIEIAISFLLTGVWALLGRTTKKVEIKKIIQELIDQLLDLPVLVWVVIGFLITYILFFIAPMFLNSTNRIHYLTKYLTDFYPIGNDMIAMIDLAKGWFVEGKSPYPAQFYPPLTYILFAPSLLIGNYATLFRFFTFGTIVSYIFLTLFIPAKIGGRNKISFVLVFFITGLFSYGLQFELERGQYNVFTFLLCMLAIYLFHYYPKYRIFAYLFFSISVQLKLYPAIFIVMLVDDWRNWKAILLRFIGLGIFNVVILFAMGYQIFLDFFRSVTRQLIDPSWVWNENHSIQSFVITLTTDGFNMVEPSTVALMRQYKTLMVMVLLLIVLACFISAVWFSYLRRETGIDTYLLLVCMIGALTIPISIDYTLSILAAPMTLFLCGLVKLRRSWHRFMSIVLIISLSFAYSSMLIPYKYKPYFMNNSFPTLFIILIIATVLNVMRYQNRENGIVDKDVDSLGS